MEKNFPYCSIRDNGAAAVLREHIYGEEACRRKEMHITGLSSMKGVGDTRIKSQLKMESVTKCQVQTWSLFLHSTEKDSFHPYHTLFRGFSTGHEEDVQMSPPSPCTEHTPWTFESAPTEPGTHPSGAEDTSPKSSLSISFSPAHLHVLSKPKPSSSYRLPSDSLTSYFILVKLLLFPDNQP